MANQITPFLLLIVPPRDESNRSLNLKSTITPIETKGHIVISAFAAPHHDDKVGLLSCGLRR